MRGYQADRAAARQSAPGADFGRARCGAEPAPAGFRAQRPENHRHPVRRPMASAGHHPNPAVAAVGDRQAASAVNHY